MKITMHCSNQYRDVTLEQEYDDNVTWQELIEQFNIFLASMGYLAHKYNNFVGEYEEKPLATLPPTYDSVKWDAPTAAYGPINR